MFPVGAWVTDLMWFFNEQDMERCHIQELNSDTQVRFLELSRALRTGTVQVFVKNWQRDEMASGTGGEGMNVVEFLSKTEWNLSIDGRWFGQYECNERRAAW